MTSKWLQNALQVTTLDKAKELFIESMREGWSVNVSISKTGLTNYQFRKAFCDDVDIQSISNEYYKKKIDESRGYVWHSTEKCQKTTPKTKSNTSEDVSQVI